MMEIAMPMPGSTIDSYEDMFKEITRKLYGEDGLPELTNGDRHANIQERGLTPIDYDVDTPLLKPEEHITAFGLAALMQNGFPPSGILNSTFPPTKPNFNYEDKWVSSEETIQWTQSKIASYNPAQKLFKCAECDCVGYLHRVTEHWLGTHSNLRAFQCPQCPYESAWARCVRIHLSRQHNVNSEEATDLLLKNNLVVQEISRYLQCLKTKLETASPKAQNSPPLLEDIHSANNSINGNGRLMNSQASQNQTQTSGDSTPTSNNSSKRYNCTYCPYATDRRDLFTRHENIHREEKPFQCYVCQKQFNRADHVKKHFLRMHREHPYDLNRIRRHPPKNSSGMSFYQKYNSTMAANEMHDSIMNSSLSIPSNFSPRNTSASRNSSSADVKGNSFKSSLMKNGHKKKGEKRFTCCYCTWSGVDNWCLKRHMNTHLKPFICSLCDYKAARSERLATHVLKVHNKRACGKCNFLADDLGQLSSHQQEHHPLEQRNRTNNAAPPRNGLYLNGSASLPSNAFNQSTQVMPKQEFPASTSSFVHQPSRLVPADVKPWKNQGPKQRLFNYMETSDGSDQDCETQSVEDMGRATLNQRLQSDFPEAGDVGMLETETEGEESELPLFVCASCGCEFEDDRSLESHQFTHHPASPAKKKKPTQRNQYRCCICDHSFVSQKNIMNHMQSHMNLLYNNASHSDKENKRCRKQTTPKRILVPCWEGRISASRNIPLVEKYMVKLLRRRKHQCHLCSKQFSTKGRLTVHRHLRHGKMHFECEHCNMLFRHRYQVVLHSSREHLNSSKPDKTVVPLKECFASETIADDASFFQNTLVSTESPIHKIGMTLFDHSFLQSNNHMPLIIPTFPPN